MDETDAALRELLAAQEEHARALAAADAARAQLANARAEADAARADEQQRARDLQLATESLEQLHVADAESSSTAPPLAASERFVVEFHRNIGCYQALVRTREGAVLPDARQLRVRVAFPTVSLLLLTDGGTAAADDDDGNAAVWWTTEVERNVDQANCVVSVKADHVHVRLPVTDGDRDVAGDGFASFSQIAAAELDARSYARLACRACENALVVATAAGGSPFERALPLPSANWVDMFDFWGAGIGAFEHLPREDIFAHAARVFVGEAHLLLHAADLIPDSLRPSVARGGGDDAGDADETRDWEPLECAQCAAPLGMRHRESAQTIRLDKHVLASAPATTEAADADVFARYSVDSVVSAKLLEFADSDGVFRFALRSEDPATANSPPMLLQLLSWETSVKTERSREFRRVLKVLYTPADATTSSSSRAAQELRFPPAICAAVASRLETSSELLPASLRGFSGMAVGYLCA